MIREPKNMGEESRTLTHVCNYAMRSWTPSGRRNDVANGPVGPFDGRGNDSMVE